jgi:hypothetical protein
MIEVLQIVDNALIDVKGAVNIGISQIVGSE